MRRANPKGRFESGKLLRLAAVAVLALAVSPVAASSRFCRDLEARLASLDLGAAPRSRDYDRAAQVQRGQLEKAQSIARRSDCDPFATEGRCGDLARTIGRMQRNLQRLELQAGTRGNEAERVRLQAALRANRCREEEARHVIVPDGEEEPGGNLYDMLFGDPRNRHQAEIEADRRGSPRVRMIIGGSAATPAPGALGSYRTLCVRLCDGYFFPISYAASELDFSRDQNRCEARCPGAEVRLYRHRVPGEESADMVSVAGRPYRDLPTAFDYKQPGFERPAGCGCSTTAKGGRGFSVIAGDAGASDELPESVEPPSEAAAEPAAIRPTDRRVRVVGPTFLPDPEEAIDLRAPARTDAR